MQDHDLTEESHFSDWGKIAHQKGANFFKLRFFEFEAAEAASELQVGGFEKAFLGQGE
jgi:hypothetical protein